MTTPRGIFALRPLVRFRLAERHHAFKEMVWVLARLGLLAWRAAPAVICLLNRATRGVQVVTRTSKV